jgi:hypothetical protein
MTSKKILNSTLLNIDSSFRNVNPKNICISNNKTLPNNPLLFTKNSNLITINYPLHNLVAGDNIVIQNVEGIVKTLSNSFYLFNNYQYMAIIVDDNYIASDYKNVVNELYMNIEVFGAFTENNFIDNIPFNNLIGIKQMLIAKDIPELIKDELIILIQNIDNNMNESNINSKVIFIKLPIIFINSSYHQLNQVFKITYLHINGIKLGNLNANFPINSYNYQSNYTVNSITDANNFTILLNYNSYNTGIGGGKNIQVLKIINTLDGYPNSHNYVINLKKSFNNVVGIELTSSEFPYIDIVVKKNINDKLYWRNIEDGNYMYILQIDEGFYTIYSLVDTIQTNINKIERIISTTEKKIYNNFKVSINTSSQILSFNPYNLSQLPNCLSASYITIDSEIYIIITVNHPNNTVSEKNTITISNATNVTIKKIVNDAVQILSINAEYFNNSHTVYSVNLHNSTYTILLGKENQINFITTNIENNGGENIIVNSSSKVSFLFDKPDTLGELLGFNNAGNKFSFTDYKSVITNQDTYVYANNVDTVGNSLGYPNGFLNLAGNYNYILMYLNDIEYIYNTNNLPSAFAKILLTGNPGDVLFNTYVDIPKDIYSKSFPISTLNQISVYFLYPDGSDVIFRNINHSFTLKITEEKVVNDNTYLNSQRISVASELKNANLKD